MKTISTFKRQEKYGKKFHTVKIIEDGKLYAVCHKYTSMSKEQMRLYDNLELAMYEYTKIIMFLLS